MEITLNRVNQAFHFEAFNNEKIKIDIDANPAIGGEGKGARPMELVLMGLGGCASIDLGLILKKQRQKLTDYQVVITATRDDSPAKAFKSINLHFVLTGNLVTEKVEKAIELTLNTYCSVALSLNEKIKLTYTYIIK